MRRACLPVSSRPAITLPGSWALYLFCGVGRDRRLVLLAESARGLWHLHVLRRSCVPVDPALLDARVRGNS